jgi:hypothetical protein
MLSIQYTPRIKAALFNIGQLSIFSFIETNPTSKAGILVSKLKRKEARRAPNWVIALRNSS